MRLSSILRGYLSEPMSDMIAAIPTYADHFNNLETWLTPMGRGVGSGTQWSGVGQHAIGEPIAGPPIIRSYTIWNSQGRPYPDYLIPKQEGLAKRVV